MKKRFVVVEDVAIIGEVLVVHGTILDFAVESTVVFVRVAVVVVAEIWIVETDVVRVTGIAVDFVDCMVVLSGADYVSVTVLIVNRDVAVFVGVALVAVVDYVVFVEKLKYFLVLLLLLL